MKHRKVTALVLAATMAVTGIGQTAMVWGSDFSDEFFGESMSEEIAVEESVAEAVESDSTENAFDSEKPAEEFVSEEAETGLVFSEGEDQEVQDVYHISVNNDTGTGNILPGASFTLNAEVWVDSAQNQEQAETKAAQVQVEWTVVEGNDVVTVSEDENNARILHVTANEDAAERNAKILATGYLPGENEGDEPVAVCVDEFNVFVRNGYGEIMPLTNEMRGDLYVGETTDEIDPEIWVYDVNAETYEVLKDGISWRWEWNAEVFEIKDAEEKTLTEEDPTGTAPFTITKLKNWDDDVCLIAEVPGEEGEEPWEIDRRYHFSRVNYDVYFNEGMRNDENSTWLYNDETLTYTLNLENLANISPELYDIVWETGTWEPHENPDDGYYFVPDSEEEREQKIQISEDNTSVTLNGARLWENGYTNFNVYVKVITGSEDSEEVQWDWNFWVDVREAEADYSELPYFYEKSTLALPRWNFGINRNNNCFVRNGEYPDGENIPVEVISVTAQNADDDAGEGEAVTIEAWEDKNGWEVWPNRPGHGVVTVEYTTWDDKAASYTIDVYIGENVYNVNVYSDTDTNVMLPGSGMTLQADVSLECYNAEEDFHYSGDASNAEIRWEYDNESDTFSFKEEEDGGLTVTARENAEDAWTNVTAIAYVDNEEVAHCGYGIAVQHSYYTVTAEELNSETIWEYKGDVTVTPVAKYYDGKNPNGTSAENEVIRYRVEGDWWAFAFRDSIGNEVEITDENCIVNNPSFTLTRKTTDGFRVTLVAERYNEESEADSEEEKYEEIDRRDFWIDGVDYSIWFAESDNMREDHYTWVYNDEELFIPLNTENLEGHDPKAVTVEWKVFVWNDREERIDYELLSDVYMADETGITLYGAKLYEIREQLKDGCNFNVDAYVMVNGEEVASDGFGADVREPYYDVQEIRDTDMLLGDTRVFDGNILHYYIENKENPYGESYELTITDISVEDLREPDKENPVLVAEQNDDGIWEMTCQNYGPALVRINAENEEHGITRELEFRIDVSSDLYRAYVSVEPDRVMLPGTSAVMKPHVLHYSENEEEPVELSSDQYSITLGQYDTNWFTVNVDSDTHDITVTAKDTGESVDNYIWANIEIPFGDDDTYTTDAGTTFWIRSEFTCVEGKEDFITEPGSTVTAKDMGAVLKRYNKKNPNGAIVEDASFTLYIPEDSKYLTLNGSQNTITVKEGVLGIEDAPVTEYVEISYVDEESEDLPSNYLWVPVTICNHKGTVVTSGSCTSNGSIVIDCPKCGKKETKVFYGGGHTLTHHSAVSATCTTSGTIEYWSCKNCGKNFSDAAGTHVVTNLTTSALGHTGGTATCTEQAKCTRCGAAYGEKLPHTIVTVVDSQPICGTPGKQHSECSVCHGERTELEDIPATGEHTFGEWAAVTEATLSAPEVQKRTCSVCGKEETREVGAKLTPVLVIPGKLTSFSIQKGQTVSFAVTMAKGDALASCTSSKKSVVKVAGVDKTTGTISLKAAKSGTAKIKITLASGMAKTYTVKVVTGTIKTSKIAVASSKVTLEKGKSFRLNATVKPFTSTQKITYTTSDKKIAAVSSSGKIKAVAPGTATITAVSGSKKATCKVTVTGIANVKSSVTVAKGKTLTLKPTLYGITDKVTYTSSNTKVATVSSKGKIKGVKKGTATITVTAGNYTVKCKVTVK